MTLRTLLRRSLRFHARSHFGVVLGAAIGSAALLGALLVGDSVRGSLRDRALQRLANAWFALAPVNRVFRADIAARLNLFVSTEKQPLYLTGSETLLTVSGIASLPSGSARANRVQVIAM